MNDTTWVMLELGAIAALFLYWAVRFERILFHVRWDFAAHRIQSKAAIGHLREALRELASATPCKTPEDKTCHCKTCLAQHALSATSGYRSSHD